MLISKLTCRGLCNSKIRDYNTIADKITAINIDNNNNDNDNNLSGYPYVTMVLHPIAKTYQNKIKL